MRMKWMLTSLLALVIPIKALSGDPPAEANLQADLGSSIEKLTASLDKLALRFEQQVTFQAEEREARRVEIAVAIMALRYRKIDRLEMEIERIGREKGDLAKHIELTREEMEQVGKQGRAEGGQLSDEAKGAIASMEQQVRLEEGRIVDLGQRELVLQNDATTEQRRLTKVEAILDAWMEKQ